ncbi:MAG: hypothetical protein Q4G42_04130 [Neisseria sp.]|nr:hypothetical protein [Neisseria sp.]
MKHLLIGLMAAAALSGCIATELSTAQKIYNPETDARVRLYGQNGRPAMMVVEHNGSSEKITVGGGMGQAFGSMLGVKGNESIGMPDSPLSSDPSGHSKLLSRAFFKEFIVPAGSKVTVNNSIHNLHGAHAAAAQANGMIVRYNGSSVTCESEKIVFTPAAGKDYEVAPVSTDRRCGVTLFQLN